jgi:Secretion system C-terminal sorting domain
LSGSCADTQLDTIPRHCFDAASDVSVIMGNAYNVNLYPNPVNYGVLTISYQLNDNSYVQFKIIDCMGREVLILNDEHKPPGIYKEQINTDNFARGVYLFIANINGSLQAIKFIKI